MGEFLVDDAERLDTARGEELADGGVLRFRLPHQGRDPVIVEGQLSRLQWLVPSRQARPSFGALCSWSCPQTPVCRALNQEIACRTLSSRVTQTKCRFGKRR